MSNQKPTDETLPESETTAAEQPKVEAEPADAAEQTTPPQSASSIEERLAAAEAEIAELKDQRLRALAETENVRKRAVRDREDAAKYAMASFARDILSVADSLERALGAIDPEARAADPALEALVVGVEMTGKQLLTVFERNGITSIAAEGQRFDPHVHDAMFEIPDESVPAGTVLQVMERGYMIHDRPLRPARVGVARGGPKAADAAPKNASDTVAPFPGGQANAYEKPAHGDDASGSKVDEKL